jgi:hypothetical protein
MAETYKAFAANTLINRAMLAGYKLGRSLKPPLCSQSPILLLKIYIAGIICDHTTFPAALSAY